MMVLAVGKIRPFIRASNFLQPFDFRTIGIGSKVELSFGAKSGQVSA